MEAINLIYQTISASDLPAKQVDEFVSFAQHDNFFQLAAVKAVRLETLREKFTGRPLSKVFLSANLAAFECQLLGYKVEILEKNFFVESDALLRQTKIQQLQNAVVIVNNNDVGAIEARAGYAEFFRECDSTYFVAWDWDNHHWLDLSTFLAAHSDIYCPAHHENLYILSRFNWLTAGPVYCSSVQWSRRFLTEHLDAILLAQRSPSPLGMHIPYAKFNFRMQVVTAVNQHYSSVGFSNRTFHERSALDKLQEWCAHTCHWIAPVLNDVPIRIFDALITGGIPIVPESLRLVLPVRDIPRDHVVLYSPADIIQPQGVVAKANALFDHGGRDGIVARHGYALEKHHGNASVMQMLGFVAELMR